MRPDPHSVTKPVVVPVEKRLNTAVFMSEKDFTLKCSNMISQIFCLFSLVLTGLSVISRFILAVFNPSSFVKTCSNKRVILSKSITTPRLIGS